MSEHFFLTDSLFFSFYVCFTFKADRAKVNIRLQTLRDRDVSLYIYSVSSTLARYLAPILTRTSGHYCRTNNTLTTTNNAGQKFSCCSMGPRAKLQQQSAKSESLLGLVQYFSFPSHSAEDSSVSF